MYYESKAASAVRVSPELLFTRPLKEAVMEQLKKTCEGNLDPALGRVLIIMKVENIGEGIIIPGDGAAYYKTDYTVMSYFPEVQELVEGEVREITKFGAFIDFGPFEGMVHISQTMEDYVSLDEKNHILVGKESKKVLKVGDKVRSRIIAVSYKDPDNPKIGLTMRQPLLGKTEWIEDEINPKKKKSLKKEVKK